MGVPQGDLKGAQRGSKVRDVVAWKQAVTEFQGAGSANLCGQSKEGLRIGLAWARM